MTNRLKFGFILAALVTIPIFIMGLIGLNTIQSELKNYQQQEQKNAAKRLIQLDQKISDKYKLIQQALRANVEKVHEQGAWALRCTFQNQCPQYGDQRLELIVSFSPDGDQIYPPQEATGQLYPEKQALKKIASALTTVKVRLNGMERKAKQRGATSSYQTPGGHHLLYCWLGSSDNTYCAAIDREWLIEQIISTIQQTIPKVPSHHLRLADVSKDIIWQNHETTSSTMLATKQLSSPFYFLRLEYLHTQKSDNTNSLTIWALTLPLGALLITLALLLFRTQKQALDEAEKRTELAASVSHELRTPLTNLQLYADLIMTKADKNQVNKTASSDDFKTINTYSKIIAAETTRLSELVNNALTIAKGKEPNDRVKTLANPDFIITETITRLAPLLKETKEQITYNLNASTDVLIDRSALEQILVNLIDNARKYANGYRIRVSSKLEDQTLTITVRDWGPNFKPGKLGNLFSPFFQRKTVPTSQFHQDGFGLGLTVCKQLAEANNGSIDCQEASPGARFIVKLEVKRIE